MNLLNNRRGFNYIEIIIGIILISLIVASFSTLFSLNLDLPIVQDRTKVLLYAQKEIEKLNNTQFSNILPVSRMSYPDDPNFDYEIVVNSPQTDLKEVRIIFYYPNKSEKLIDLYSEFILVETLKICDDFEVNNESYPPWDWIESSNQWSVVLDPTNPKNHVYRYTRTTLGWAYPDWAGLSNYSVTARFYITNPSWLLRDSYIYIGGRTDTTGNNGYFIYFYTESILLLEYTYTEIDLIKVVNGNTYRLYTYYTYDFSYFDQWGELKLVMNGNRISYYFNGELIGEVNDDQFSSGRIFLIARTGRNNRNIYFDDICVEEIK